jgi:outer membrane protein OmpA-like peptidoglycan-associated protein
MKRNISFSIIIISLLHHFAFAQLNVDTTIKPDYLIDTILAGRGIRMGNIKCTSDKRSVGYYTCPPNKTGLVSGVLLSTGYAAAAAGPNTSPGTTGMMFRPGKKWKGDKDLNRLAKGLKTYDVTTIEFDFIPLNNRVVFEYSFGSEEYKEYVGSQFNDVFGFFVTGPGMKKKNVALLPGSNRFVAINNVNQNLNKTLFVDNDPFINNKLFKNVKEKPKLSFWQKLSTLFSRRTKQGDSILYFTNTLKMNKLDQKVFSTFQYDGFTKKMKVQFYAVPYEKYHIKISIADVGDAAFDSGVFLEEKSFISFKDTTQPKFADYPDKSASFSFDSLFAGFKSKPAPPLDKKEYDLFEKTLVFFGSDSYEIPDTCKGKLSALSEWLKKHPDLNLSLTGFADNTGNAEKNKALSEKRANAVMNFLIFNGVKADRLEYIGNSSEDPIGDNKTPEGRALNRRVEIDVDDE